MTRSKISKDNNSIVKGNEMIRKIVECKCAYATAEEEAGYGMILTENADPINTNTRRNINEN